MISFISFMSLIRYSEATADSSTTLSLLMQSMAFSSISFLIMTPVLYNKAAVSSSCFALPVIFALDRSRSPRSFELPFPSCRMTPVASSGILAQPEI